MSDLGAQLLSYGEHLDEIAPPLTAEELDGRSQELELIAEPRRRPRPWLVAAAAAAAVLILIGGIGLLTRTGTDTEESAVVDQVEPDESLETPRLTENIPPGLESGIVDTSVGDARWVRLTGDLSSLPRGEALRWPTGFAIFERRQSSVFELRAPARLWVTPDGVEWRVEPIPAPDDAEDLSLTLVDGEYWLLSVGPNRLWRSSEGATWDEYDLSGLAPPGPAGFNMRIESHRPPVKAGDLTVLYVQYVGLFPAEAFGFPRQCAKRPLRLELGVYQMIGDEECPQGGPVLRFIETETGLQVLDNATGEVLGEILEADLTHIETMAETDELSVESLFVIGDGEVTRAEKPWPRFSGSDDGAEFGVVPPGRPDDTNPVRLESGWFATDGSILGSSDGDALWMHVDGTWISLVDLGMEHPEPGCIVSATAIETTTFFFGGACFPWDSAARNVWILSLEPSVDQPTVTTVPADASEDPIVLQAEAGPVPRFDTSPLGLEVVFEPSHPDDDIADHLSELVTNSEPPGYEYPFTVGDRLGERLMALISDEELWYSRSRFST